MLTAIYPAPTVALATGVVSVATVPSAVAVPAQDIISPSSPMAMGVQGSLAATPQPNVAVEVKREDQLDGQAEDGGYGLSSCGTSSSSATCVVNTAAGNALLWVGGASRSSTL